MKEPEKHNMLVRESFTRQAENYAQAPVVTDRDRLERLVRLVDAKATNRLLEVATGPGLVALALARHAHEVVGVDLTEAPLVVAERQRQAEGASNVRFEIADAADLHFADGAFDVVVCRFGLHHFMDVPAVVAEMTRVCRPSGRIVIEDLVASNLSERGAFHNHLERLRDPSHARAYPLPELLGMFTDLKLEIEHVSSGEVVQSLNTWLSVAHTPKMQAEIVQKLLTEHAELDHASLQPWCDADGEWHFIQRTAIVIGRKLSF